MALKDEIYAKAEATEHRRYLFPKNMGDRPPSPEWIACNELVNGGHAQWLSTGSIYWPGIVLTDKPDLT